MKPTPLLFAILAFLGADMSARALEESSFLHDDRTAGGILLVDGAEVAPFVVDPNDHPGGQAVGIATIGIQLRSVVVT